MIHSCCSIGVGVYYYLLGLCTLALRLLDALLIIVFQVAVLAQSFGVMGFIFVYAPRRLLCIPSLVIA